MTLASMFRTRLLRAIAAFAVLLGGLALAPSSRIADAAGTPDVSLSKSAPAEALAGDTAIPVTLSATNTSGSDGFNLTFVDVLQPGVSFVSSTPSPTQVLSDTPHAGETTVVWRNVSDLQAGVTETLTYTISSGTLSVGTQINNSRAGHDHPAGAYVNSDPRVVPTYNTATDVVDDATGWDTAADSTTLVAFLLDKTEPNTEAELLRGLQDHQTVYTLEISNNHLGATNDFAIEDWLPAGMEFLGCGGVDNSTVGEEYPGAGPINPGNEPALANPCPVPSLVETVVTDPPGPLPSATYTHVEWDIASLATSLPASGTARFDYIAAIPMNENTTTWAGATPATDGAQASNLDNNNGPSTEETGTEIEMVNTAVASGTYSGNTVRYSDQDDMTVTAEDLSIHKSRDHGVITHGAATTWTLLVETSEYVGNATSLIVTDIIPDGLDFAGSVPAHSSGPTDNGDGTLTVTWNLADMTANGTTAITFDTTTRSTYRFTGDPVLANDSWTNSVAIAGNVDGRSVADASSASQSAGPVSIVKEVATRVDPTNSCGDGSAYTWNDLQANGYRIGDRVCWRLGVDFPANLDTFDSDIQDYLPPGHEFTAGDSWALGANNTVAAGDVSGPGAGGGETVLTWTVGDGGGYVAQDEYFEVVFSSTIVDAGATSSGEIVENLMKYSWANTGGTPFNLRDLADVEVLEAQLSLAKEVNTGGGWVDSAETSEADSVDYRVTLTNSGGLDANDVEVWDNLPPEYDACAANVGSISNGGSCASNTQISWTGLTVPAGGSLVLTYTVTFPTGVAPDETLTNEAGVVSYTSATNNGGGTFTYVPANNIDPGAPTANTTAARDDASVYTAANTIAKDRTTAVDEAGNAAADQATIGEIVSYTIDVVIPEGTTVGNAYIEDVLPANLELVIPVTPSFTGASGATDSYPTLNSFRVQLDDTDYTNTPGTGDDTLSVTFDARVIDVPLNSHGTTVTNTATFYWDNQDPTTRSINDSVNTTVVEPDIGATKSSTDSIGNDDIVVGGETVNYEILVTNANGAATAHDLVAVDTLPEGVTPTLPIPDSGVWVADGTPGDGIGGTITWTLTSLAPNASFTFDYQVTVDDPIIVSTALTNTVEVLASSMSGSVAEERSGSSGVPSRYRAADSDTQSSPLASIAKSVTPGTATIGEVVTYTIDVTIPAGTIMYDATIIDTLPTEIAYDGMVGASSCDMNGSACDPMITATELGASGQVVSFWLDDIDMPSVSGEDRVVTIVYEAHVVPAASRGDTPDNSAMVWGNQIDKLGGAPAIPPDTSGFDVSSGPATDSFTVVEPALTIDKDVAGQVADDDWRRAQPGDTLSFTVTVRNNGAANLSDAHDLTVVDSLTDLSYITVTSISDGGVWDAGADTITWTITGPLAPSAFVSRTYDVIVDTPLGVGVENPAAAELINTADVPSYFGVSSAGRAANPGFTYIEYDDVTADTVEVELDLASIGDYVWFDVDADGVQDGGEPGLAGIDVTVTYHGPDDALGGGDDEVHNTTTDAAGAYLVDELPGGQYTIVIDDADLPAGMVPSYNLDGTLDHTWSGALAENQDKTDVDFGYTGSGSIGDTVWFDIDLDGTVDGTEFGLEGVDVDVTWLGLDGLPGGDDVAYSATTDASGTYTVSDLPAGNYVVDIVTGTLPAGMSATYDADGGLDDTSALTLAAAENNTAQDFGYAGSGTLGDYVWLDSDGDGLQDPGEQPISGVDIQLTWPGEDGVLGGGDDHTILTTTDGSGLYLLENLPPGEYRVDVLGALPTAAANTYDEDGGNDSSVVVNLTDGENHRTTDFGYRGSSSIGDTVWWDIDGDNALSAGEPGLTSVELTLVWAGPDDVLGNGDDLSLTRTTDTSGNYLFDFLPEGNYSVTVASGVPGGFVATYDEDGGTDETSLLTLGPSPDIHLTADFGYTGTGSVGDLVYLDGNADGNDGPGEPGIPAVDMQLTWYGQDGTLGTGDDAVLTTTTDGLGFYGFSDLPAGDYDVEVLTGTLPPGLSPTGDADGVGTPHLSSLPLGVGGVDTDQDFGYRGGGSVGDTIWFDRNADGALGADEFGLEGVEVVVTWGGPDGIIGNGDDEAFVRNTDAAGNYLVTNLPPGAYQVWVNGATLPVGMSATFDEDGTLDNATRFTLIDGTDHLTADFGYNGTGEVGDLLWLDLDGDGFADAGEPGLPGQTVELTWEGPDGVIGNTDDQAYTVATDPLGGYLFDGLPPGDYEVAVTGSIVGAATNTHDEDGDDDSHTSLILSDGASHLTADFGYVGSAELGDLVWLDFDGDGMADGGEPGLTLVEVVVTWYGADGLLGGADDLSLPTYTTDAFGNYLATSLPDGNYGVAVMGGVPAGLFNSHDEDSDLDSHTDVAGLSAGASHLTADFGYSGAGTLGDTIWWDLDADTTQGAGEPGFAGVGVALTWAGLNGVFGDADDAAFTTTTDADGLYVFELLPPGDYIVAVDESGLPSGVVQSADPDGTLDGESMVSLGLGQSNLVQDFGYRGVGSVGDWVWFDLDGDGLQTSGEIGVPDVSITISFFGPDGLAGGGDDVDFITTTDGDGIYLIPGLPSGFYSAALDPASVPAGLTVTGDLDGGNPMSTQFTLGAGEEKTDVDYPIVGDASLGGTVWNDLNADEVIDPAEAGLQGVTINVTWASPAGPYPFIIVTGSDGTWDLSLLPPGDYTVQLDMSTVPAGLTPTTATVDAVTLPAGGHGVVDFGLVGYVNLGSTVWIDSDGDGEIDPDEAGIPDVLVNLYDEYGALVSFVETDADGNYLFTDLLPGTYTVQLDPDSLPAELWATFDRDGSPDLRTVVTLADGTSILDANFGFQVGDDDLPRTGLEIDMFLALGMFLTLFGTLLVMVTRIRSRRSTTG